MATFNQTSPKLCIDCSGGLSFAPRQACVCALAQGRVPTTDDLPTPAELEQEVRTGTPHALAFARLQDRKLLDVVLH